MELFLDNSSLTRLVFPKPPIETPPFGKREEFYQYILPILMDTEITINNLGSVWKHIFKKGAKEYMIFSSLPRFKIFETKSIYYGDKILVFEIDPINFEFQKHEINQTDGKFIVTSSIIKNPKAEIEKAINDENIFCKKVNLKLHRLNYPQVYNDYLNKIFKTTEEIVLISLKMIFDKNTHNEFILEETQKKVLVFKREFEIKIGEKFEKITSRSNTLGLNYIDLKTFKAHRIDGCIILFSIIRKENRLSLELNFSSMDRDVLDFNKTLALGLPIEDLGNLLLNFTNNLIEKSNLEEDFKIFNDFRKDQISYLLAPKLYKEILKYFEEESCINPSLRKIREGQEAKKLEFEKVISSVRKIGE